MHSHNRQYGQKSGLLEGTWQVEYHGGHRKIFQMRGKPQYQTKTVTRWRGRW